MNFIGAVNRVLRSNGILKGDDDDLATFADVQHNATSALAQISVQDELNDLISDSVIPYEVTSGTISATSGTRLYTLASDFVRFHDVARLYYSTGNRYLFEYPGGRETLALSVFTYQTDQGEPNWWYLEPGTTKRIGLFHVPNASFSYTYEYEKSVAVTSATDTMPFHTEPEAQAFCQAAGRRFKAMFEERADPAAFILRDPSYITARSRLHNLIKGRNSYGRYGALYR